MSIARFVRGMAAILAGRWQAPLAICALVAVGVTLFRVKPAQKEVPFDALLADIVAIAEAGEFFDAANAAANLIEHDPPFPKSQLAVLHDTLANVIYQQESLRGLPNRNNIRLLLEHHELAATLGLRHDAHGAARAARAHEWLGERKLAVVSYEFALGRDPQPQTHRTALQGLVRLLDGVAGAEERRRGYIEALLAEEGVSQSYLWWALQHAVRDALDGDDVARASKLLSDHAERFQRSDLKGYHDYLWAWVHVNGGETELARPLVERVDQWLDAQGLADAAMDKAGYLPAMNQWLRGRIELAEARPQAALACFDRALALQSHGDLLLAATVGRTEALGMLERHEAARETVRQAVARAADDAATLSVGRPRLRNAVVAQVQRCRAAGAYADALAHLELALELAPLDEAPQRLDLLEQYGTDAAGAVEFSAGGQEARELCERSAKAFEEAADLAVFDEPRHASLLWSAAEEYDLAGRMDDARRVLLRFVDGRSLDPRMPQALLRLGKAYAADGAFEDAIKHYGTLIEEFPRLEEASRARLLTVDSLMAMGAERHAEAERILRALLEDRHVSPKARVYRDALAALCDLLYQRRAYAGAIGHMEDFLIFYPNDSERYRIRFMLADAYRFSAYELRDGESTAPENARRKVSRERFARAAELFDELVAAAEADPSSDETRAVYERLVLFYRGDCLFELNDPATLDEALAVYRQAAARYQGEPAALTAQVQIANIYLRQGKMTEAARAVERARWLLGSVPDRMFTEYGDGMNRVAWDRYLTAARSSYLFKDVFAEAK